MKNNKIEATEKSPNLIDINNKVSNILEKDVDEKYFIDMQYMKDIIWTKNSNLSTRKIGHIKTNSQGNRIYDINKVGVCITALGGGWGAKTGLYLVKVNGKDRIRSLTPKEAWRMQGFSDDAFEKARKIHKDTPLYKQAGNAVTTTIAYQIGLKLK